MRNIVQLWEPTVTTDNTGQETYSYALYRTVYAQYNRDSFTKSEDGFVQASGQETVSFILRFDPAITYNHRIVFEGETYRITALDNYMNLRHELRLTCTAVDL